MSLRRTTGARRVNIRERPINERKKLPLKRLTPDMIFESETDTADGAPVAAPTTAPPVESKPKVDVIPTPPTQEVLDYQTLLKTFAPFEQPRHYVKLFISSGSGMVNDRYEFYDLLNDDIEWLHQYLKENPREANVFDESVMEKLIDMFEKKAFYISPEVDCRGEFPQDAAVELASEMQIKGKFVEAVYLYWLRKRNTLGKALIREYQQPPAQEDPSPYVAFRPRTLPRRISQRNPRKNDAIAFDKLRTLKKDSAALKSIAAACKQREMIKWHQHLVATETFDVYLAQSKIGKWFTETKAKLETPLDPNASENLKAEREWCIKLDSLMQSTLPHSNYETSATIKSTRRRGRREAQSNSADPRHVKPRLESATDEQEELSDSEADEMFFHELELYVEGKHPKAQALKITSPSNASYMTEIDRKYIGRCRGRIGRGGRYLIDRVTYTAPSSPSKQLTNASSGMPSLTLTSDAKTNITANQPYVPPLTSVSSVSSTPMATPTSTLASPAIFPSTSPLIAPSLPPPLSMGSSTSTLPVAATTPSWSASRAQSGALRFVPTTPQNQNANALSIFAMLATPIQAPGTKGIDWKLSPMGYVSTPSHSLAAMLQGSAHSNKTST